MTQMIIKFRRWQWRWQWRWLVMTAVVCGWLLSQPPAVWAATYYVDATAGLDTNDGLSTAAAWQSISQVNSASLTAGDQVLFKRGETWIGTRLVAQSGATDSPIIYGAYGSGAEPIIDGNDAVDCVAVASGGHDIEFQNLHVTQCLDFGFHVIAGSNISLTDCEADNFGNDGVIFITGSHDNEINGGHFHDGYERAVGPLTTGIEISDGSYNITVDDVEVDHNAGAGISIHSHSGTGMPAGIVATNLNAHHNRDYGINIMKQDSTANDDLEIEISDCQASNNSGGLGMGINVVNTTGVLPAGITISRCQAKNNAARPFYVAGKNVTIQNSLLVNGTSAQVNNANNVFLYHNTFYSNTTPLDIRGTTDGVTVRNCAFMLSASGTVPQVITTTNVTFDFNIYKPFYPNTTAQWRWGATYYNWANWLANTGQDANSLATDPLFLDVANEDFRLQADSPAIDQGTDLSLTTDLAGTSLPQGSDPDLGAYEFAVPAAPTSLSQYQNDGTTLIAGGSKIVETAVVLKFQLTSENGEDSFTPEVEFRPTTQEFTGSVTHSGSELAFSGQAVTGEVSIADLTPGVSYHWRARVSNGVGSSNWVAFGSDPALIVDQTEPTITIGSPTLNSTSATINWTTDEPATSQVEYGLTTAYGSSTTEAESLVADHQVELANLTACTVYHYRVISADGAQNSATSADQTLTTTGCSTTTNSSSSDDHSTSSTPVAAPGCNYSFPGSKAPWLYGSLPVEAGQVQLFLAPGDGEFDHYVLEYGLKSGQYSFGVSNFGDQSTRTYTVGSLLPGVTYYFRVRAGNHCAAGPWSNELAAVATLVQPANQLGNLTESETKSIADSAVPASLSPAKNDAQNSTSGQVKVKLVDQAGQGLAGIKVELHSQVQTATSDQAGWVVFNQVEKGAHQLKIVDDQWQGVQDFDLGPATQQLELTLVVTPRQSTNINYWLLIGSVIIALGCGGYIVRQLFFTAEA